MGSTTSVSKRSKEPRFVPYEPYKAAITPLVTAKAKSRPMNVESNTDSVLQQPPKQKGKANQQTINSEEIVITKNDVTSDNTDLLNADNNSSTEKSNESSYIELQ